MIAFVSKFRCQCEGEGVYNLDWASPYFAPERKTNLRLPMNECMAAASRLEQATNNTVQEEKSLTRIISKYHSNPMALCL